MYISNEDEMLYVVGGYNGKQIISKCECFDEGKDEWKMVDFLNHPYAASRVFNVDVTTDIKGTFNQAKGLPVVEQTRILEGPVTIRTSFQTATESSNQVIESNGNISTKGMRHGLFVYKLCTVSGNGEDDTIVIYMHPFIYHENCIQISYENYLLENKLEKILANGMEIPSKYCCPITKSVYKNPVVLSSGNSYKRQYYRMA